MNQEEAYRNREIDIKFLDVHGRLDSQDEKLDKILTQTTRTNGRVNALENWRWLLIGGLGVITVIVIPLVVYIWNQQSNSDRLLGTVEKALSQYEQP